MAQIKIGAIHILGVHNVEFLGHTKSKQCSLRVPTNPFFEYQKGAQWTPVIWALLNLFVPLIYNIIRTYPHS